MWCASCIYWNANDITMGGLWQISGVYENIWEASTKSIKAFHNFVFGEDGGRRNRSCLREFSGFGFTEDSEKFKERVFNLQHFEIRL